ncbi:MAG: ribonucleoside-diphosphate reductase, partial [Halobacteria archaeon]|nr:ribonucleoside-diphosphate reductase [Halobacteria archaeon]
TVTRKSLAQFGAGEEAVTEDLAPLAVVLDDIEDEMFVTTQMYEEAKHNDFFDRYWREVINPVEEAFGLEKSSPREDRWFCDDYDALFDKEEERMHRLLEEDTPENRVKAYCTYHLTAEGIIAQTGYWGLTKNYTEHAGKEISIEGETVEIPEQPGLVEGLKMIMSDEGRHVGFGMSKIKEHIEEDGVDIGAVEEKVGELLPYVMGIVEFAYEGLEDPNVLPISPAESAEYTQRKHQERMEQIADSDADIPDIDELTALE